MAVLIVPFGLPIGEVFSPIGALRQAINCGGYEKEIAMAIENFRQLADYNHWANLRIYSAALEMPEEQYRRSTGVFFGSLHGTLNHLLLADRIWLKRLTGDGDHPTRLDAILFEDRHELARARRAEDARLIRVINGYSDADLAAAVSYQNMSGAPFQQKLHDILL